VLRVLGIRHHSPACARLVAHVIERDRPRHVLIEGPADMNERIAELLLPHRLPVAIFTYLREADAAGEVLARRHASWTPFCAYSPEWIAVTEGHRHGAQVRFCDLPAWDPVFSDQKNRYADPQPTETDPNARVVTGRSLGARYVDALCKRYGVDDMDTLWDHLFEGPSSGEGALDDLEQRLQRYFELYRDEEPGGPRDAPREALMARYCAWAMQDAAREVQGAPTSHDVLLICGGFHAPFVARRANALLEGGEPVALPELAPPREGARFGSYLVPYGYRRLDAFAGYDAGMPSPQFYELVHEHGPEHAAEALLSLVVTRLRGKKQPISTADLIAVRTGALALAALRGHPALLRTDVLDGLASALVKDGLEQPLPWSKRGRIRAGTHPLLVEVVAALSGDREGKLAEGTPQPPLVADVTGELSRLELEPSDKPRTITLSLREPRGRAQSRVLHRLAVLEVPGFERRSGPIWATDVELDETWFLFRTDASLSALIEASIWGATLESAALARIEDALLHAEGRLSRLTAILGSLIFVGIESVALEVMDRLKAAMAAEPALGEVGTAIRGLLDVYLHGELLGAQGAPVLEQVLDGAFDRGLWLLEARSGPDAPLEEGDVLGISGLRDLVVRGPASVRAQHERARGVFTRRTTDAHAPPAVRGGCLGGLWSSGRSNESETEDETQDVETLAVTAIKSASLPTRLGDFLGGLFYLARTEALEADGLMAAIDGALSELGDQEFMISVASLRLAFSFFPPRERRILARKVLVRRGSSIDPSVLLRPGAGATEIAAGLALDRAATELARRFGLKDGLDG